MEEYDTVSRTYNRWTDHMGEYTQRIIKPELIQSTDKIKLLDLACGTGYISEKLMQMNHTFDITAVDISKEMLNEMNDFIRRDINVVHSDVIDFLRDTTDLYDGIYCGWALPYFNYNNLIHGISNRLKVGGIVSVISNSKGTLAGMESIFLNVMKKNQDKLHKPMSIAYQLPNNKYELIRWFEKQGFKPLEVEENEVEFFFDSPEELLEWLMETGALAGTRKIFKDYSAVKNDLIKEIKKKKYKDNRYVINHRFVYGIFKKQ